ncbi:MAG: hypothetical protein V2I33_22610, partial [Kangiellaceae bacterium]|nr:hypothetical protein [Kangiellaceae bacterium]
PGTPFSIALFMVLYDICFSAQSSEIITPKARSFLFAYKFHLYSFYLVFHYTLQKTVQAIRSVEDLENKL